MPATHLLRACSLAALIAALPLASSAASRLFPGPSGWDHTVGATATSSSPRAQETWKKSDGEYVTYLADGGLTYDDSVSTIQKNITDNKLKATVDRDRTCAGHRAHEVEMAFGTTIVHQLVIDDAPGVTKVTYSRPQSVTPSADVTNALNAYCPS